MASDHGQQSSHTQSRWLRSMAPFTIGGISGSVATTCIHPIDMVKIRLQLVGEGVKGTAGASPVLLVRQIIAEGSFFRLYNGLSAADLRQFTYTTLRVSFFDVFLSTLQKRADRQDGTLCFSERAAASLRGGGLAAWICTPVEVALVRMGSDRMKPAPAQKNYRSGVHALVDIVRNEGLRGLWRGSYPTAVRAMSTNFGQLGFFAESKARLRGTALSKQTQTVVAVGRHGLLRRLLQSSP